MAHLSEAACLLNAGALYGRRVLLEPAEGEPIFAGLKTGAFSLYFGDAPIFHFDRDGRWQRAYVDDVHYLKGLDTSVQAIERVRVGENLVLKRRTLRFDETSDLDATIKEAAVDLSAAIEVGRLGRIDPPPKADPIASDELLGILDDINRWDAAAWFSEREKYVGVYGALPFLPPDALNSVVLQATVGASTAFGLLGIQEPPTLVRTPPEFEAHAKAAAKFLGRRVEQSKNLFIGGSDLLAGSSENLESILRIASSVFPVVPRQVREVSRGLDGIHLFADRFGNEVAGVASWKRRKELGLTRVSLGIESGDPAIRSLYGKTWRNEELVTLVSNLVEAGIGIGLVVLIGAGGETVSDSHLEATLNLVSSLPLGAGEIVSLIDPRELQGNRVDSEETGSSDSLFTSQMKALKAGLQPWRTARKTKVVFFSLEKQGAF